MPFSVKENTPSKRVIYTLCIVTHGIIWHIRERTFRFFRCAHPFFTMRLNINPLRIVAILSPVTLYLLQATSQADIDEDLQAYWRFEGSLLDQAAEFHGRARGGTVPFSPDGKFGQCAYFDGKNSFIEIAGGRPEDFDFEESSFTVSAWFKADAFDEGFAEVIVAPPGAVCGSRFGNVRRCGVVGIVAAVVGYLFGLQWVEFRERAMTFAVTSSAPEMATRKGVDPLPTQLRCLIVKQRSRSPADWRK